jgi:hypothetical protein
VYKVVRWERRFQLFLVIYHQICRFHWLLLMILTAIANYNRSFNFNPSTSVCHRQLLFLQWWTPTFHPYQLNLYNDDDNASPSVYYHSVHIVSSGRASPTPNIFQFQASSHHLLEDGELRAEQLTTKPTVNSLILLSPGYLMPYCIHHLLLDDHSLPLACLTLPYWTVSCQCLPD